jgi:hypothetical protein
MKPCRLALVLAALLSFACASGPTFTPATGDQIRVLSEEWGRYREGVLRRETSELFYDARVLRNGFRTTATLAVRDDPGRSLSLRAEGPLGRPLVRADWDGAAGAEPSGREAARFGESIGVPLSAKSLSLLLFGLPAESPPEQLGFWSGGARYSWEEGNLFCDFDLEARKAQRVVAKRGGRKVEINYLAWQGDLPSRIQVKVSLGGTIDLELCSEFHESP